MSMPQQLKSITNEPEDPIYEQNSWLAMFTDFWCKNSIRHNFLLALEYHINFSWVDPERKQKEPDETLAKQGRNGSQQAISLFSDVASG
jgi:hypothetical protein